MPNETTANKQRLFYLDLINVVAALAVVFLHANGVFWEFKPKEAWWLSALIIEQVFYFAVPVFFMLTGATLLGFLDRYDIKTFFRKRLEKVALPYVAWGCFGAFFRIVYMKNLTLEEVLKDGFLIKGLLTGKIISVYWFFIPLFVVYFCIPLFASLRSDYKKQTLSYLAVIAFVVNALAPFCVSIVNTAFGKDFSWPITLPVGSNYLLYVVIGYLLATYELKPVFKKVCIALGLAGLVLMIAGTYYLSVDAEKLGTLFRGYENVPTILYSVAVFLLLKDAGSLIESTQGPVYKAVRAVRSYTFPLYLIHFYILTVMVRELPVDNHSLAFRLIAPFAVLGTVMLITAVLRKIPVLRNVVPG